MCAAGADETSVNCATGTETPDGLGCRSPAGPAAKESVTLEIDCDGVTEDGVVDIRVEPVGTVTTCDPYTMSVTVE